MALLIPLITTLIVGVFTLLIAFYLYVQYQYGYWKKRNIFYEKPTFPYGNMKGLARTRSFGQVMKNIYDTHKKEKAVGIFGMIGNPGLLIRDLDLIKNIMIKDFSSFTDRGFIQSEKYDPLTGHLFFLSGRRWRNLRIKLTPTFTSGKMKMMFPTLLKCGEDLKDYLRETAEIEGTIEVKEIMSRYTMDVIASCAFGLDLCSFQNPNSEFRTMGNSFFKPNYIQILRNNLTFGMPKLAAFLRVRLVPQKVTDFFIGVVKDTIQHRENNNVHRNDFMQLLIELKNKGKIESVDHVQEDVDYDPNFTINQAAAQAFVFFVAGFETSSTTLMFCLFELALHQEIQNRLREEVDRVIAKHGGGITYEGIQEMEYLDQVVSETLRKYPPVPQLVRQCTKAYRFPEIDAEIEKDTRVFLSVLGLHYDPEYYPDPEKFDPDRFSSENKEKRNSMCYLPFGDGPRNCIGNRFGLMQTKTGLAIILSNFKVKLSEKMKLPLEFDPKVGLTAVKGNVYLKILKR